MSIKKHIVAFLYFFIAVTAIFFSMNSLPGTAGSEIKMPYVATEFPVAQTSEVEEPPLRQISQPSQIRLYFPDERLVKNIDVEEYVAGVLTAEMYSDSPLEALKAVAVAARTYTLYMCEINAMKEYDVVADPDYSQGYIDESSAYEVWSDSGSEKFKIMKEAVRMTDGEILTYNGTPICALYHASSYPATESCENVFVQELPYLKGKKSVEGPDEAYRSSLTMTFEEFNEILADNGYPTVDNIADVSPVKNSNGRCEWLRISDDRVSFVISGKRTREVFGLRSTSFDVTVDDGIVFDVYGFGHGVGLSQNGAVIMANNGKSYVEILKEYYTGAELYKTIYK